MPSVFKPKGRHIYRIEFKNQHGKTKVISSGTTDEKVAASLAAKIQEDADRLRANMAPLHPDLTGPYLGLVQFSSRRETLAETIKLYLADLERRGKAAATVRHARLVLNRVVARCAWGFLADITADSLTRFLARLRQDGGAPNSANAYRDRLHTFLEWCIDQGRLHTNPIHRVKRSDATRSRPYKRRAFTADELRSLLAVAPRHRDLYTVAALSGLRKKELHLLEKRDVDLTAKLWRIRPEVDKTGRAWVLPILPDLLPTLARLCLPLPEPTSRLFPKKINDITFRQHLAKAKIPGLGADGRRVNFHSLRYTFCTLLARRLPIQEVQRLMRHGDIRRTVNLYLDLGLDDLARSVAALPSVFDPAPPAAGPPAHPDSQQDGTA
jgi:integrase